MEHRLELSNRIDQPFLSAESPGDFHDIPVFIDRRQFPKVAAGPISRSRCLVFFVHRFSVLEFRLWKLFLYLGPDVRIIPPYQSKPMDNLGRSQVSMVFLP